MSTCRRRIMWEKVLPRGRSFFTTCVVILKGRLAITCKKYPSILFISIFLISEIEVQDDEKNEYLLKTQTVDYIIKHNYDPQTNCDNNKPPKNSNKISYLSTVRWVCSSKFFFQCSFHGGWHWPFQKVLLYNLIPNHQQLESKLKLSHYHPIHVGPSSH